MKNLRTKLSYAIYTLLVAFLFTACDNYPYHKVFVGKQNLIVYKVERINDSKNGTFKYAITDATGKGWTLKTFEVYQVGDTLKISK
tara:strand:- start:66 stop:323 length:258 start_codon:yes stop_codon:yes gene_type:complete